MNSNLVPVQQQVLHLISQIQCEDIRRKREIRECNRQNITVPITINFRNDNQDEPIDAVTRDLSSLGIGLISKELIEPDSLADISLHLEAGSKVVFARCKWCRSFGGFNLSGWKFETDVDQ